MANGANDGIPARLTNPQSAAERLIRVIRSGEGGIEAGGLGEIQKMLAPGEQAGMAIRGALEAIAADEARPAEERIIAANMAFTYGASTSPLLDAIFLEAVSARDLTLCGLFFTHFITVNGVPPVTVPVLERYLASGEPSLEFTAAALLKRPESLSILGRALHGDDDEYRAYAASALARMPDAPDRIVREAATVLASMLKGAGENWELGASYAYLLSLFGQRGAHILPVLGGALRDPTAPLAFRQWVLRAIREIGKDGEANDTAVEELIKALDTREAATTIIAVRGLAEMGKRPKKAVRALIRLLDHEDAGMRSSAVELIGDYRELAAEAAIPLLELWDRETVPDLIAAIARTLGDIGRPALEPLLNHLDKGNVKDTPLLISFMSHEDSLPLPELFELMVTRASSNLGYLAAGMVRMAGPDLDAIMPTLRDMLASDNPAWQLNAAIALAGAGQDALPAAPELAGLLATSHDPQALQWAASCLRWIGPDAAPEVAHAIVECDGPGLSYLRSLLKGYGGTSTRPASPSSVPDLSWCRNREYLRLFRSVGEILRLRGACSYKELYAALEDRANRDGKGEEPPPSIRKIGLVIEALEKAMGTHTGNPVRLTDRKGKAKGGLTPEGEAFLDDVIRYLKYVDSL